MSNFQCSMWIRVKNFFSTVIVGVIAVVVGVVVGVVTVFSGGGGGGGGGDWSSGVGGEEVSNDFPCHEILFAAKIV